jgi:hypothetical protein
MIKFFRRIRYNLIRENNTSKYIKYAIGEIILVLIGILLALAISDWNTDRLNKQSEIASLIEMKKSILIDLERTKELQKKVNTSVSNISHLQKLLKNKDYTYTKDLDTLFGEVYGLRILKLNNAFYEDLKSIGLNLIRDENLRMRIVELFEKNHEKINWINELEMSINDVNRPYHLKHFHNLVFASNATPNNFDFVWKDSYYHNIVDYRLITLQYNQVKDYALTIELMSAIVAAIDKYIID